MMLSPNTHGHRHEHSYTDTHRPDAKSVLSSTSPNPAAKSYVEARFAHDRFLDALKGLRRQR